MKVGSQLCLMLQFFVLIFCFIWL